MANIFKNGEIVYLNSGSPKLTVTDENGLYSPIPSIVVTWLNEANEEETMLLPTVCFKREAQ